jgi:uncharacterized protein YecT (DUF1311 family)
MSRALIGFIFLISLNAFSASFNCDKAYVDIERSICNDPDLSKLDSELSISYTLAKKILIDAEGLMASQVKWLAKRNSCKEISCISKEYKLRMKEIESLLGTDKIDILKAGNIMLEQRGIQLGMDIEAVATKLRYGSIDWGSCYLTGPNATYRDCKSLSMPVNIFPSNCDVNNYSMTPECYEKKIWGECRVQFHFDESKILYRVTIQKELVLMP